MTKLEGFLNELSFYSFWDERKTDLDWDEEDRSKPLIHFSFETWFLETRPCTNIDKCDTGRWRSIHFRMYVSRYLMGLTIPFRPIADHIPTRRQIAERENWITSGRAARMEEFMKGLKKNGS